MTIPISRYTQGAAISLLCAVGTLAASSSAAHEDQEHCAAVVSSVEDAGFAADVDVACADGHAVMTSDTYPDHDLMTGIVGTNEQIPVPAKAYAAPVPLQPVLGTSPQTRDAALGVAINGVPIFDYTGGGEMSIADLSHHQAQHDTLQTQQLDICGGHAGRGDDYHYHVAPVCMIAQMENAGDAAIIGWGFDGYPIYGDKNPDGSEIAEGTLDVCNGQPDDTFGYRYHTSAYAPYIIQCLMGEVADIRELPRTAPLTQAGQGLDPGRPPQGGVEDLVFSQDASGLRSMDYNYQGEAYYMRYTPSQTPDCYDFETRTVTNDGEVVTGEYCR
jgi:hypothetical protein